MEYYKFLDNQNRIYAEFRRMREFKGEGVKPNIQENKGGYIIALRHLNTMVNEINKITTEIYNEVDCIEYNENNIHTTLGTYDEHIGFKANKFDLEKLYNIAKRNISLLKNIKIKYDEWLINQDSIIIAGQPSLEFVNYMSAIESEANKNEIKIKRPWGAHITIGRFLNNIPNENRANILNKLENNVKIIISEPKKIDVGYYKLANNQFNFYVYKSIEL